MKGKTIITAAITGSIHTPTMSEYLPITPQEIADDSVRAYEAGAAVCHIHVRNPETGQPIPDINLFKEAIDRIKSRCNMVICITTGGGLGMTAEQRLTPVAAFKPELASFNAGSVNFALFHALDRYKNFKYDWENNYLAMTEDFIFPNTFKSMKDFSRIFNENDTKPEFEVYGVGGVLEVDYLIEKIPALTAVALLES